MWTEQANELNVESLLWPRTSAWGGAAWEARSRAPRVTRFYQHEILDPQQNLKSFTFAMFRECIPFTPMHTMWCYFGDQIGPEGSHGVRYCDKYAAQYLNPLPA